MRDGLVKPRAACREKNDGLLRGRAVGERDNAEGIHRSRQRLGLKHHAFAAAEGPVVDGAMPVVGVVAQVVHVHLDQLRGKRSAQDAVSENACWSRARGLSEDAGRTEEVREDSDNVEARQCVSPAAWALANAFQCSRLQPLLPGQAGVPLR